MSVMEQQLQELQDFCQRTLGVSVASQRMPNGGVLVSVEEVPTGPGWNRGKIKVLFVAPPGYPAAQPDCFWVEPGGLRLEGGGTPHASNDANPIPGDIQPRNTTWFSWHLQSWNPSSDSLLKYFNVILSRLTPAR